MVLIGDDFLLFGDFVLDRHELCGSGASRQHLGYETTYHEVDRTVVHKTWGPNGEQSESLLLPGNIRFRYQLFMYVRMERPSWFMD